jgi:hypothetical protein
MDCSKSGQGEWMGMGIGKLRQLSSGYGGLLSTYAQFKTFRIRLDAEIALFN